MAEAIFIGYRRGDTADVAGRIYDAMSQRFGKSRIFKDVDNIGPGVDFGDYIRTVIPRCRVALMLIGPGWLESKDELGKRRLDDDHDWVRIEVETALATPGVLVVPVLINGARMPRSEEVPETIRPLLRRNAAVIRRDPDFHDDVERLATALRNSDDTGFLDLRKVGRDASRSDAVPQPRKAIRMPLLIGGALAAALVIVMIGFPVSRWLPNPSDDKVLNQTEVTQLSEKGAPEVEGHTKTLDSPNEVDDVSVGANLPIEVETQAMANLSDPSPTIGTAQRLEMVGRLQSALKTLEYYTFPVDGLVGEETQLSAELFANDQGVTLSSLVDAKFSELALFTALAERAADEFSSVMVPELDPAPVEPRRVSRTEAAEWADKNCVDKSGPTHQAWKCRVDDGGSPEGIYEVLRCTGSSASPDGSRHIYCNPYWYAQ